MFFFLQGIGIYGFRVGEVYDKGFRFFSGNELIDVQLFGLVEVLVLFGTFVLFGFLVFSKENFQFVRMYLDFFSFSSRFNFYFREFGN